ncbi:MAG: DUF2452 domain-containing protein [Candidatus Thiodiazotropha sp.]
MSDHPENPSRTDHASPYPVSRLAPAFGLVDLAREIALADEMLANRAEAHLKVIAEQVRILQQQARQILQQTQHDQQLHHALCSFRKRPGQIYHLYHNSRKKPILSMLSPQDWRGRPPNRFIGSFRLEHDRSWTPTDQLVKRSEQDPLQAIHDLLQTKPDND